jgi:hypothetical protein
MEHQQSAPAPFAWRHLLWLALLVASSIAFSLGLACAVPLAAFAAAAALTLPLADALLLILLVWLANQLVGFSVLGYPWDTSTIAWGAVLGGVAVLSTAVSRWTAERLAGTARAVGLSVTFLVAFAVYEAALFVTSATLLGGTDVFTAETQGRILVINAAAFVGLLALNRLATSVGLVANGPVAIHLRGRPA